MSVAKNHHQIVLRAGDAAEKFEWLARLRNAAGVCGRVATCPPLQAAGFGWGGGIAEGGCAMPNVVRP